jgi:choline dehydrogenase-like flavoprotein
MRLSHGQRRALQAICDALIPALDVPDDPHGYWARRSSDLGVDRLIVELVSSLDPNEQRELARLLRVLDSPALGLTWNGPLKPAHRLAQREREAMLCAWSTSPVPLLRKAYHGLKKLTCFLFYGTIGEDGRNPNWPAIGYPGPLSAPPAINRPIRPLVPDGDLTLTCHTVVIGSGAGGGVVAGVLAEAGVDVIVLEKGPYVDRDGFDQLELRAMERMYEQKAALTTDDGSVGVLAGSCLGGGTTINWTAGFRTPDEILRQWADEHRLSHLAGPDFQASLDAIVQATHVGLADTRHNRQNQALADGCAALGYQVGEIPRNTEGCCNEDGCRTCGYCGFGCQKGTKRGTLATFLLRAHERGARILADTEAERVTHAAGRVTGVVARYSAGGRTFAVRIRAERVVVAAGALHTPSLLVRSGLGHPHLGRHLYFHPTVAVAGIYPSEMHPWHGPMMTAISNEVAYAHGLYGAKIETPPAHPGLLGLALPWRSGRQHKETMAMASRVGAFIVLTRDRDGGEVRTDRRGRPRLRYRLSEYDRVHMLAGIEAACRIHVAAGAERVILPHHTCPVYDAASPANLDAFLAAMPGWGWQPNRFPMFSAHQMGTCRMGGVAATHPVAPDGNVRVLRGLYVADASVFPASSGVNPMVTIEALAHFIASGLV